MKDYRNQVLIALNAYLERTEEALRCEAGDVDSFADLLQKRKFAFYNMRVAATFLEDSGFDLSSDSEFRRIWKAIDALEDDLREKIRFFMKDITNKAAKFSVVKKGLSQYHSGDLNHVTFEKTV